MPIESQLAKRFCKFLQQVFSNDNAISALCGKLLMAGSASAACNNVNHISNLCNISRHELPFSDFSRITSGNKAFRQNQDEVICSVIKDCIMMQDDVLAILTNEECGLVIKTLCTQ